MPSINFNPAGITALMNFNMAQTGLSITQSRIATGKKVQSSVDDPAAIATSQRLIAQKNGVSAGIENSKSADLLLSTADKALSNMQDIMQNMRQIAGKASNDATTDEDRVNYQKQIDDYRKELDRISRDTKYKERHLLNGDIKNSVVLKNASGQILTNIAVNESSIQGDTGGSKKLIQEVTAGKSDVTVAKSTNNFDVTFQIKLVANGNSVDAQIYASNKSATPGITMSAITTIGNVNTSGGVDVDISAVAGYSSTGLKFHLNQVDAITDIGKTATLRITSNSSGSATWKSAGPPEGSQLKVMMDASGIVWPPPINPPSTPGGDWGTDPSGGFLTSKGYWPPPGDGTNPDTDLAYYIDYSNTTDKSIAFQVGANAGEEMLIGINDMSSNGLRINRLDVSNSLAAKNSVSMIDDAIDRISDERARIGSMQNRLKVSISNSETYKMNLEGSLAQEVDVNYAESVLQQTIDQVRQQASLAMLTQANQAQQAVLGLLR
jgi:flagellin